MGSNRHKSRRPFSAVQGGIMLAAMVAFVIIVTIFSYRQLQMEKTRVLDGKQREIDDRVALLDAATESVMNHVSRMQLLAQRHLVDSVDIVSPTPYLKMVQYNNAKGYYSLYQVAKPFAVETSGTVYGNVNPHDQGPAFIRRVNLAVSLFPLQAASHAVDQRIAQSFYKSPDMDVATTFPLSPIEGWLDVWHGPDLVEMMGWSSRWVTEIGVAHNAQPFWEWYLDPFGNGMVATCVAPLTCEDEYLGIVGATIRFDFFEKHLRPRGAPAGVLLLSTVNDELLMTSQGLNIETLELWEGLHKLEEVLPIVLQSRTQQLLDDNRGEVQHVDGYYFISLQLKSAPWTLVYIVSDAELAAYMRPQLLAYAGLIALLIVFFTGLYLLVLYRFIRPGLVAEGARARLAAIVEQSDDAIISETIDATIVSWNTSAERIFDCPEQEAIGKPVSVMLSPEQDGQLARLIEKISQGEKVKHFETSRRTADGNERHLSLSLSPIKDGSGKVIGVSTIARDVTQQKETEVELIKARTTAEYANQAKSQFLANMSHELRTPLTAILGFSEMLLDPAFGKLNEEQAVFAKRIGGSGTHLLSLIDDLLDLAKIEAGKIEIEPEMIELGSVCGKAVDLMKDRVAQAGLTLEIDLPDNPVLMLGDPQRLQQILVNLLSNAVKFTLEGIITVWIKEHPDNVEFGVKDTGQGISRENQNRLFKHYEQVHDQRTVSEMGTGLGLALCREIAEAHGGTIQVESEVGLGSNFYVRLPRVQDQGHG